MRVTRWEVLKRQRETVTGSLTALSHVLGRTYVTLVFAFAFAFALCLSAGIDREMLVLFERLISGLSEEEGNPG